MSEFPSPLSDVEPRRLYIVVDGSMPVSTAAPQSLHALTELALEYPEHFREWREKGNIVIVLEEVDGAHLARRLVTARKLDFLVSSFSEPDWKGGFPSAIAFVPDTDVQAWLSDLPLSGRHGWVEERRRRANLKRRWHRPVK